jgi:hypothetical protein
MNRDTIRAKVIGTIRTVGDPIETALGAQVGHCYSIMVNNQFFNSNFSIDIIQVI